MLPVLKTLLGCLSEDHRIICILVFFLGQNAAQPHRIKIRNSEVCSPVGSPSPGRSFPPWAGFAWQVVASPTSSHWNVWPLRFSCAIDVTGDSRRTQAPFTLMAEGSVLHLRWKSLRGRIGRGIRVWLFTLSYTWITKVEPRCMSTVLCSFVTFPRIA